MVDSGCRTCGGTGWVGTSHPKMQACPCDMPRTPPTPAAEEREAVARAICALHCTECSYTFKCDYGWHEVLPDADAALSALAPYRAAEILAAEANERARIVASLRATSTGLDLTKRRIADAIERGEHGAGK